MKILVFGHSLCAPRQIRFWRYFSSLGHTVRLLPPRKWMFHEVKDSEEGSFSVKGVELFGGLRVRGLLDLVRDFKPDILYSNEPTYSGGSLQAVQVGKELGIKVVVFEWDNIRHTSPMEPSVLKNADLFICGCPGSLRVLVEKGVPKERIWHEPIIQVGVDTNLFKPFEAEKEFDTVTCSGFTENKGITSIKKTVQKLSLKHLWLGASRPYDRLSEPLDYGYTPGWMEYEELPKWYNKAKLHILFSRDTPEWKEQNGPYANLEGLACGLPVVMSEAGDAPYFIKDCPAVKLIPQNDEEALKKAIMEMLNYKGESGRNFILERFSYGKIVEKLVRAFGNAWA